MCFRHIGFEQEIIGFPWEKITSFVFIFEIRNSRHRIHKHVPIMIEETMEKIDTKEIRNLKFGGDLDLNTMALRFWFYDERTKRRPTLAHVGYYNFLRTEDEIVNYTMSLDFAGVEHAEIPIRLKVYGNESRF